MNFFNWNKQFEREAVTKIYGNDAIFPDSLRTLQLNAELVDLIIACRLNKVNSIFSISYKFSVSQKKYDKFLKDFTPFLCQINGEK